MSDELMTKAKQQYEKDKQKQRLFGEFNYAAGTWDRQRRVIARIEHGEKGENPRYIVTSLAGEPQQLYDEVYCQRGAVGGGGVSTSKAGGSSVVDLARRAGEAERLERTADFGELSRAEYRRR